MAQNVTLLKAPLTYGGELLDFRPDPNKYYQFYALRHCLLKRVAATLSV